MAFKQVNKQIPIKGFYKPVENNPCQGFVRKLIWQDEKKGKGYFLVELSEPCQCVTEVDKKIVDVTVQAGDFIGLSRSAVLQDLDKYCDEGGPEVKVVYTGRVPSKKYKNKDVKLFDVFVDE
jgi:hypothetical protein